MDPEDNSSPIKGMSKKKRIIGLAATAGGGLLLCILSSLVQGSSTAGFIIMYMIGVVAILICPIWLVGPKKQFKQMADKRRLPALIAFLVLMVVGIILACVNVPDWVCWIPFVLSWVAIFWYVISYIPFLQDAIIGCFKGCCGCCFK